MSSTVKPLDNYNDFGALTGLARDARSGSAASIRETARQFESLFTRMVLKSVRDANLGDPLFGDDTMKSYEEMYDDQLALQLSSGKGLGLAEMLVRQLTASGASAAAAAEAATGSGAGSTAVAESAASAPGTVPGGSGSRIRKSAPYAASPDAAHRRGDDSAASPAAPAISATSGTSANDFTQSSAEAAHTAFVRDLWPSAVSAGAELGVDPRTLIAHAALETGWGKSMPGSASGPCSHNLFGIKSKNSWSGESVASRTVEFAGGVASLRTEKFRAYASTSDCFADYVALLRGEPRYAQALGTGADVTAFGNALQQGGYATDPHYAAKLAAVANSLKQTGSPPLTASQGGT